MISSVRIGGPHSFGCDCFVCRSQHEQAEAFTNRIIGTFWTRPIIDVEAYSRIVVKFPDPVIGEGCWRCGQDADFKHPDVRPRRPICCGCAWEVVARWDAEAQQPPAANNAAGGRGAG